MQEHLNLSGPQSLDVRQAVLEFAKLGAPSSGPRLREASCRFKSPWLNFYWDRIGDTGYEAYVARQYEPFLNAIHREWRPGEVSMEVGCGLGTITKILGRNNYHTRIAVDLCQHMVEVAKGNLLGIAKVIHADMRTSSWLKADVIHGHGVLDHLSDHDIYRTLEAHRKSGARVAIHYVPGELHGKPSFGNERLPPVQWWEDKWDTTEAHTFNGGKDYVLLWRF